MSEKLPSTQNFKVHVSRLHDSHKMKTLKGKRVWPHIHKSAKLNMLHIILYVHSEMAMDKLLKAYQMTEFYLETLKYGTLFQT